MMTITKSQKKLKDDLVQLMTHDFDCYDALRAGDISYHDLEFEESIDLSLNVLIEHDLVDREILNILSNIIDVEKYNDPNQTFVSIDNALQVINLQGYSTQPNRILQHKNQDIILETILELLNHQFHFQLEIIDQITKKFEPFLSDDLKSHLKIDIYQNTQTKEYQLIFNIDSNDEKEYQQHLTELEQSIQLYHTYYYQFIKANRCLLYQIKFLNAHHNTDFQQASMIYFPTYIEALDNIEFVASCNVNSRKEDD